jgi:hypothetical protein
MSIPSSYSPLRERKRRTVWLQRYLLPSHHVCTHTSAGNKYVAVVCTFVITPSNPTAHRNSAGSGMKSSWICNTGYQRGYCGNMSFSFCTKTFHSKSNTGTGNKVSDYQMLNTEQSIKCPALIIPGGFLIWNNGSFYQINLKGGGGGQKYWKGCMAVQSTWRIIFSEPRCLHGQKITLPTYGPRFLVSYILKTKKTF